MRISTKALVHLFVVLGMFVAAQPARADVIVCFGDSITEGGPRAGGGSAYPDFLRGMVEHSVVNAGNSGEKTIEGIFRIEGVVSAHRPKYVFIMEGSNDNVVGISPATVAFNLMSMAEVAKQYGAKPVVSTITPNTRFYTGASIPTYNNAIINMVSEHKYTLVDSYSRLAPNWPALTIEGQHPNDAGARIIAEGFAPTASESGGGDSGPCFIATAAFGSYMEPHVMVLRQFRDQRLLTNTLGQWFVRQYYRYSPPIADYIAARPALKATVRTGLLPVVGFAWVAVNHSAWLFLGMLLLAAGIFWVRQKRSCRELA